jgi:hypothetical protein
MRSASRYRRAITIALMVWVTEPGPILTTLTRSPIRTFFAILPATTVGSDVAATQSESESVRLCQSYN